MAESTSEINKDSPAIPRACQYKHLAFPRDEKSLNENPQWLKDQDPIPLWSHLKALNCTGQQKTYKDKHFMVEIPGRLVSLFGSESQQTDSGHHKIEALDNLHLMANIFALCAAHKINLQDWSVDLLDTITSSAFAQYTDFLKRLSLTDNDANIVHYNGLMQFNGDEYKLQIYKVAAGTLYMPFGLNKFNLARALKWFFQRYQFGCLKCGRRTLAIGKMLTQEQEFFMYDCQSCGYPLFADQYKNSYILRTCYLQILIYCVLKTLNFSEKMNFIIYNVDVTIINPIEQKLSMPTLNQFKAKTSVRNLNEQKVANNLAPKIAKSVHKKVQKNLPKNVSKNTPNKSIGQNSNETKSSINLKTKISGSQEQNRKLILDPNKMYYIVAVPKAALVTAKVESKHLILPTANETDEINKTIVGQEGQGEVEKFLETINLEKSASTVTLTPKTTMEAKVITNPESLGLKVYLLESDDSPNQADRNDDNKIKIVHQLRDLFMK